MAMTRYMADSVDGVALVDRTVDVPGVGVQPIGLTAGYANGTFHASSQDHGATDVQIDVNGSSPGADVLDIENGDATPLQAVAWVHGHNAHGGTTFPAVLYCNRSTQPVVENLLTANGLQVDRDYKWWIATLDGTTVVQGPGVLAVQAWNAGSFTPRNIDLSIVYDDSWKPSGAPAPLPVSTEDEMFTFSLPPNSTGGRYPLTLPVGRACQVTLSTDGTATLTEYGWVAPDGGNGFSETNVNLHDKGAHAFSPPKGTGKVDIQYRSDAVINGVVDILA